MFVIAGLGLWHSKSVQDALDDPKNNSVVSLNDLHDVIDLPRDGQFIVSIYRQSGNLQQDEKIYTTSQAALRSAVSTFARAKIDVVIVDRNDDSQFAFRRAFHSHRGRAEGKKVGSAVIRKVA